VGAALLSVSAINTIRNRTLPETDFCVPSQVLIGLNRAFPMEEHGGKYFTIFYAIYDTETRELVYASGGHPPAISIAPDGTATQLAAAGMIIGAMPFAKYADFRTTLTPGTKLFVFSDGCYEVFNAQQDMMSLEKFSDILAMSATHPEALDQALAAARDWQDRPEFDDDFSLMEFHL
jgi:sigma-B regulation protein RsbU (phosphoserine phosphatase)